MLAMLAFAGSTSSIEEGGEKKEHPRKPRKSGPTPAIRRCRPTSDSGQYVGSIQGGDELGCQIIALGKAHSKPS